MSRYKSITKTISTLERQVCSLISNRICYVDVDSNYTLQPSDIGKTINVDTTGGDVDIIFTDVSSIVGYWAVIRNVGTGTVTLLGATEVVGTSLATQYTAVTVHIPAVGVIAGEGALT